MPEPAEAKIQYFPNSGCVFVIVLQFMLDILCQEMVNGDQQLNSDGDGVISECSTETNKITHQSVSTTAPKILMVINKDGSKTIMTLVSGKNMSESDSGSNLAADASNDSQDSNSGIELFLHLHNSLA